MKTLLSILLLISVVGCSQHKEKTEKNSFSEQMKHRNKTYSKTDVLLAIKHQVNESVVKAISDRIKSEFRTVPTGDGHYGVQVDTNYALTIRTSIQDLSHEYQIPPPIIASILIDKELLELTETLPDAVGDEVVERLTPPEKDEDPG